MARRTARLPKQPTLPPLPAPPETGDLLTRTGLRQAGIGIPTDHPDAALFGLIVAYIEAERTRHEAYNEWSAPPSRRTMNRAEAKKLMDAEGDLYMRLLLQIGTTPAKTSEGAMAKIKLAFNELNHETLDGQRTASILTLPMSALKDALAFCG